MTGRVLPDDALHAGLALSLAARARKAAPNPRVGAVVVRDGVVVGQGWHEYSDRSHAECVALKDAGTAAAGATLYVSLEPCSTQGRTPPCVDSIIKAGIKRVVACMSDPTGKHSGRGLRELRRAGIDVTVGLLREEAVRLNEHWLAKERLGRPHVTIKLATSIDGRIAGASGDSRWITGPRARTLVHEQRRQSDAILVGAGTLVADDPRLTVRLPGHAGDGPLRCVLDPMLSCKTSARLLGPLDEDEGGGAVILFTRESISSDSMRAAKADALREAGAEIVEIPSVDDRLDLRAVLAELADRGAVGVLVEGGSHAAGSFLKARLVDRLWIHVGPAVLGGEGTVPAFAGFGANTLKEAVRLWHLRCTQIGDDVAMEAIVDGGFDLDAEIAEVAKLDAAFH